MGQGSNHGDASVGPGKGDLFYPTDRNPLLASSFRWLRAKAVDDDCGGLWRIHDDLYDLERFSKLHPGGEEWISLTKGTDITEAVETMHVMGIPKAMLDKYRVRRAEGPRKYRYTFKEDGFYRRLKTRAASVLRKTGTGPTLQSKLVQDCLASIFLVLLVFLSLHPSLPLAIITGLLLGMSTSCAHNWFHQRDSRAWRRYYFDLSLLSHRDWRISHALSHHLLTNSLMDAEVSGIEPYLSFLPVDKNAIQKYVSSVYFHLFIGLIFPFEFLKRVYFVCSKDQPLYPENLLPVAELAILMLNISPMQAAFYWVLIHGVAGHWLVVTSVTTTHHHPELYHAGDAPRSDTDWGLTQLDTVRDLKKDNMLVILTTFGHHLLHHLFPAVDHSRLAALYPALDETLAEEGEVYRFTGAANMVLGMHKQLARTEPKSTPNHWKQEIGQQS